ncbi:MAG: hypothetical protein U1E65_22970 [Myxococcota bacterium]
MSLRLASILTVIVAAACSTSPAATPDAGDTTPHATPGICIPDMYGTGNDLHVGAFCSPGGNQCGKYDQAPLCSIDLDPEGDNFCIRVGCHSHAECGNQGCCTGRENVSIKACVPKGCLTNGDLTAECPPIPGLSDAGTSSTADAGRPD